MNVIAAGVLLLAATGAQGRPAEQFVRLLTGEVSASAPTWIGDEGIVPPRILDQVIPAYTTGATRAGIEGEVYVGIVVTEEGRVDQVKLIRGLPDEELTRGALEAIANLRFEPASRDGQPVRLAGVFRFVFEIQERSAADTQAAAPSRRAYRMGEGGVVAPKLVHMESPEYTEAAKEAGIEGEVYFRAIITPEGTIVEAELVRGLEDDELNHRAREALMRWRFEPGIKDGEPVPVEALFTISFRRYR